MTKISKKTNTVQQQLANLIEKTPEAQTIVEEQGISKKAKLAKKAMEWALKKFGPEGVYADGERNEKQAAKFAIEQYTEHKAQKAEPANDAMEALVDGAKKRKAAKEEQSKPRTQKEIQADVDTNMVKLQLSFDAELKNATQAFIDGPVKNVSMAFLKLFLSRKDGSSIEAAQALEACRVAFDGCMIILSDVETKSKQTKLPKPETKSEPKVEKTKPAKTSVAKKPAKKGAKKGAKK